MPGGRGLFGMEADYGVAAVAGVAPASRLGGAYWSCVGMPVICALVSMDPAAGTANRAGCERAWQLPGTMAATWAGA